MAAWSAREGCVERSRMFVEGVVGFEPDNHCGQSTVLYQLSYTP